MHPDDRLACRQIQGRLFHQRRPVGLPGPATIARLPLLSAARATAGPPVTQINATPRCLEQRVGRFERRFGNHTDQVVDTNFGSDGLR